MAMDQVAREPRLVVLIAWLGGDGVEGAARAVAPRCPCWRGSEQRLRRACQMFFVV
jgi:hypothetical protein